MVIDHPIWNDSSDAYESVIECDPNLFQTNVHTYAFTQRACSHIRTKIWRGTHAPLPTHAITDVQKHTSEISDARPSGPQTAVCHDNHGRMTWTQRNKTAIKQENIKGNRLMEIKGKEQKFFLAWEIFSLGPEAYFNLSACYRHTAGAKTLYNTLFFLFPADLPCFHALRCFGHAESRENRHLQNFFPSSLAPLCWKIEKWLCTVITQLLHSPFEGLTVWGVFTEAVMMSKWEY